MEQRPRVADEELEKAREGRKRLEEADLKGALSNDSLSEAEKEQLELDSQKQEDAARRWQEDYQISYALDIIKGLNIYQLSKNN